MRIELILLAFTLTSVLLWIMCWSWFIEKTNKCSITVLNSSVSSATCLGVYGETRILPVLVYDPVEMAKIRECVVESINSFSVLPDECRSTLH